MLIKKFKASWNPSTDRGEIIIQLENNSKHKIGFVNMLSFNTFLLILKGEKDAYYDLGSKSISTGIDSLTI